MSRLALNATGARAKIHGANATGDITATLGGANGILAFSSDSGDRSAAFSLVYNPAARPGIRDGRRQIGAFSPAGVRSMLTIREP